MGNGKTSAQNGQRHSVSGGGRRVVSFSASGRSDLAAYGYNPLALAERPACPRAAAGF